RTARLACPRFSGTWLRPATYDSLDPQQPYLSIAVRSGVGRLFHGSFQERAAILSLARLATIDGRATDRQRASGGQRTIGAGRTCLFGQSLDRAQPRVGPTCLAQRNQYRSIGRCRSGAGPGAVEWYRVV